MKLIYLVILASVFSYSSASAKAPQFIPTDAEIVYLPPYCAAKLKGTNEQHWRTLLGNDFQHVHHLCYAQNARRKAVTVVEPQAREYLYHVALQNYDYMEEHVSPRFILRETVYIEKAGVYHDLQQNVKAEKYYLKAIEFKPDYTKSYAKYSDFLNDTGRREKAVMILRQGLKKNPDSRLLRRRLKRLTADK